MVRSRIELWYNSDIRQAEPFIDDDVVYLITVPSTGYLGLDRHANLVSDSLYRTLVEKRIHTSDIGGTAKTSEVIASVLEFIEKEMEGMRFRS
ncbi:hypothetical protein RB195_014315 [Necator americanus]|uniref:Uncharacterized protein n=1 Tax=Necator americanus TaxID=51031 RepID=A0ABR1DZN2_NECAM